MKLLRKSSENTQLGNEAFAQRLEAIASRSKVGTALYDSGQEAPSNRE